MATTDSKTEALSNDDRLRLAIRAACEIEALARATIDRVNADTGESDLSIRGMAVRIRELSGAVMCAVDFRDGAEGLMATVNGVNS